MYRDAAAAVLHVDPVLLVVPDALDAQVVGRVDGVRQASQRLDEECLGDVSLAGQYQDPRVNAQPIQAVLIRQLQQLDTTAALQTPPPTPLTAPGPTSERAARTGSPLRAAPATK